MINCLLIDDEPFGLEILESFVSRVSFFNIVGKFNEPLLSLPYIYENQIDLLFLDIQMPDISGTDFFRSLRKRPEVIFTTAYPEFALQGFELSAIDYLLKPIAFDRFINASNKAKEFIDSKRDKNNVRPEYFFINAAHKIYKIFYEDILYLESLKDYTKIYFKDASRPLLILQTLKYFEDILPRQDFLRIHRSYIVPIKKLHTITRKMVTIAGISIPVGDNYRENLFSRINLIKTFDQDI